MLNGHYASPLRLPPQPDVFAPAAAPAVDLPAPVRLSITISSFSSNKNRLRIGLGPDIVRELTNGLAHPKLKVEGDVSSGLRIYCTEHGGYSPMISNGWFVHVPLKTVRGRPNRIALRPVAYTWDRQDKIGPVLCIPRLPDDFIPEPLLDKLPNSRVDPETRAARKETAMARAWADAEQRLNAEMAATLAELAAEPIPEPLTRQQVPAEPAKGPPAPKPSRYLEAFRDAAPPPEPLPEPPPPPPPPPVADPLPEPEEEEDLVPAYHAEHADDFTEPEPTTVDDVRACLSMLNELVRTCGEQLHLFIEADGTVKAQRRVVEVRYVDI